ncbi:hypothetical protein [Cellulomonas sp. PSBB021]|uniref:hypothetical protein n=1 Tax=Cellulomonas sp. PSBB021 TaxID=2003551 RepID=UPI0012FD4C7A|nr:hypothetical protein [Cellulomonas sp. PSBB021]
MVPLLREVDGIRYLFGWARGRHVGACGDGAATTGVAGIVARSCDEQVPGG